MRMYIGRPIHKEVYYETAVGPSPMSIYKYIALADHFFYYHLLEISWLLAKLNSRFTHFLPTAIKRQWHDDIEIQLQLSREVHIFYSMFRRWSHLSCTRAWHTRQPRMNSKWTYMRSYVDTPGIPPSTSSLPGSVRTQTSALCDC